MGHWNFFDVGTLFMVVMLLFPPIMVNGYFVQPKAGLFSRFNKGILRLVSHPTDTHSPMFNLYKQRFQGNGVEISYDQLRTLLPDERFNFNELDKVFQSWNDVAKNKEFSVIALDNPTARLEVRFEHDNHWYLSDSYISHCCTENGTEKKLNVKLPNNGFIYPHPDELKVFAVPTHRHRSSTFVKLDRQHLNQFPTLVQFAKEYLHACFVNCQLFYDFESNKFDFKAFNGKDRNAGVCLSFYHFDPIDYELDDDDYWLGV